MISLRGSSRDNLKVELQPDRPSSELEFTLQRVVAKGKRVHRHLDEFFQTLAANRLLSPKNRLQSAA